jgi:hypothetical protein
MIYKVFPTNKAAHDAIARAADTLDKRLSLDEADTASVVAYALAHRHQPSIYIPSHNKLTTALVEAQVLGRTKGSTNFFVKSTFATLPELSFDTEDDNSLHNYTVTKSGLWVKCQKASSLVNWGDVAGLGYGGCYYFGLKDAAATLGAFQDNAALSVSFQECNYANRASNDELNAFKECFLDQAWRSGVAVAPIAAEGETWGFVVANPDAAIGVVAAAATRHLNRHGPRFSIVTRDRYGREAVSWGSYL